jgi:excisionase family DNA binding protein
MHPERAVRAPTVTGMDNKRLLTPGNVAERYGVAQRTVRKWVREGRLPAVRLTPKVLRIDPDALAEWERDHEVAR